MDRRRVCVIGAGPAGMSVLYHLAQQEDALNTQCYEKQQDWGGMWNYTWKTGTDEYGEPNHGSMYKYLWSNAPKEVVEFPNYTFEKHFGRLLPSYAPRSAIRDYLVGRFTNTYNKDLRDLIRFNTPVRNVHYRKETDDFEVTIHDNIKDRTYSETFSYVIVASGIFSVPKKPGFPGIDGFEGLVLHSHDFRDAKTFSGQRIVCIGASYSAEDVAIQCLKFGAKKIICTWKSQPMNYTFPEGIEERPLVERFEKKTAFFKDGSQAEVDVVIYCTGYQYCHPFLEDSLRLQKEPTSLYPDNLYKGIVWTKGGNNKLLYVGAQNQFFTFPMFDNQASWIQKYIMGELQAEMIRMKNDINHWRDKLAKVASANDGIDFQADYILDLASLTGYQLSVDKVRTIFKCWIQNRADNIATYRDQSFASAVTGRMAPALKSKWINIHDDSIDFYVTSSGQ